jgi:hypothetical protein
MVTEPPGPPSEIFIPDPAVRTLSFGRALSGFIDTYDAVPGAADPVVIAVILPCESTVS